MLHITTNEDHDHHDGRLGQHSVEMEQIGTAEATATEVELEEESEHSPWITAFVAMKSC